MTAQTAIKPAFAHLLPPRTPTTEQMADDALLLLSRLRDRLVIENANIPACRIDEAMEITLSAVRTALGIVRADDAIEEMDDA